MSNNVICCLRYFSFNVTSVYLSSTSLVESKQTKFQLRHKKWVLHLRAIREGNYLGAYHPRPFIDWPKSIASFYTKITIFHMTIFPLLLLWNTFLILTQSNIFRSCLCFIKTRSSFLLVSGCVPGLYSLVSKTTHLCIVSFIAMACQNLTCW